MGSMLNKIFAIVIVITMSITILLMSTNLVFAEITPVTIDDVKDHDKRAQKLNKIIDKINQDQKDDREETKQLRKYIKYQLSVDDKIIKKMIQKNWVGTHAEVEPN